MSLVKKIGVVVFLTSVGASCSMGAEIFAERCYGPVGNLELTSHGNLRFTAGDQGEKFAVTRSGLEDEPNFLTLLTASLASQTPVCLGFDGKHVSAIKLQRAASAQPKTSAVQAPSPSDKETPERGGYSPDR